MLKFKDAEQYTNEETNRKRTLFSFLLIMFKMKTSLLFVIYKTEAPFHCPQSERENNS